LAKLYQLRNICLDSNDISDISPLVENRGFTDIPIDRSLDLCDNPLNAESIGTCIPELVKSGVKVSY